MAENLFWQRQVQSHQEDGPVDGVEAGDVLADNVQAGGPVFFKELAALAAVVAKAGDIVGQRIQPDVDDVLGVEVHRDAPLYGGAGHAQVLEPGQQEVVHHLVAAGDRLDKVGVGIYMVDEPLGVVAHLEEVGLLLLLSGLPAAVGALAVYELALGEEGLALVTIEALIGALVDVPLVVELFEYLLNLFYVVVVGGADKVVVAEVHQVELLFYQSGGAVHELLGGEIRGLGLLLVLFAVLVGAGLEVHVIALHTLEAGDAVG